MSINRPFRHIQWLNYALLVVNVTALATILLTASAEGKSDQKRKDIRSIRFLKEQLDLTDEQYYEVVQQSDRTFRRYNYTLDLLCDANISLLEEMARQDPDPVKIERLTRRIGTMHTNLKNLTVEYFDNVRSVCTEDQNTMLASLFKMIMQLEARCEQCNRVDCPRKERLEILGQMNFPLSQNE